MIRTWQKYVFGQRIGFLKNLTSYYKFNGNFQDIVSPDGWELTQTNDGRFSFQTGYFGQAGQVTNHIGIRKTNSVDLFHLGSEPFTFSVKVLKTANSSIANYIFMKRAIASIGASEEYALIVNNAGIIRFYRYKNTSNYTQTDVTSMTFVNNTWYEIAVTSDGTNIKIYVNGALQTTTDSTTGTYTGMPLTSNLFTMFNRNISNNIGITWLGKIDEFIFWKNRELTATEVLQLYNRTKEII